MSNKKEQIENLVKSFQQILNKEDKIIIGIKAVPGAKKTEWVEIFSQEGFDLLKTRVAAVPEKGRANKELIYFLAQEFKVDRSSVKIIGGHTSNYKLIQIKKSLS